MQTKNHNINKYQQQAIASMNNDISLNLPLHCGQILASGVSFENAATNWPRPRGAHSIGLLLSKAIDGNACVMGWNRRVITLFLAAGMRNEGRTHSKTHDLSLTPFIRAYGTGDHPSECIWLHRRLHMEIDKWAIVQFAACLCVHTMINCMACKDHSAAEWRSAWRGRRQIAAAPTHTHDD